MKKEEKLYYQEQKPVGGQCLCNWGGLVIFEIEYGINDFVVAGFDYGNGAKDINRHKIEYTSAGRAYFRKFGARYYFDNIMKF